MSIFEYDEEKEMKLIRADERRVGEERGEALKCVQIIKKMYSKSTPAEIGELLEVSEELVKEVIAVLTVEPQIDGQELVKIVLESEQTQVSE